MKRSLFVLAALMLAAVLSGCIGSSEEFDARYGSNAEAEWVQWLAERGMEAPSPNYAQQGVPERSLPRGGFSVVIIVFGVIGVIALSLPHFLANHEEKTLNRRR